METNKPKADSDLQRLGKRKREHKGIDEQNGSGIFDKLPDDLLIAILSRMSIKDAVCTSILSSRWRYLWMFTFGTLEFDDRDSATGTIMAKRKFKTMVNHVLKLHIPIESLTIHFSVQHKKTKSFAIDDWVHYVMLKEVKRFELNLSVVGGFHCDYEYPKLVRSLANFPLKKTIPAMHNCSSVSETLTYLGAFASLRSLRLVHVNIQDEVVQYLLASCRYIEQLCIRASNTTKDLEAVDPLPNLKVLELSNCPNIQSLVISAESLVSCTYQGKEISQPFKRTPNLSQLTLGGEFCESFIYEPNQYSGYSVQLVKLVLNLHSVRHGRAIAPPYSPRLSALKQLELNIVSQVGRSLLFFTSLIKASPHLEEFKIKIDYLVAYPSSFRGAIKELMPFPEVTSAETSRFHHKNLKVISMAGYCGCASEEAFLVQLCEIAPSLHTLVIDTDSDYYCDHPKSYVVIYRLRKDGERPMEEEKPMRKGTMTQLDAKKHAEKFASSFPSKPNFVIT